jgi:hypothetical protein
MRGSCDKKVNLLCIEFRSPSPARRRKDHCSTLGGCSAQQADEQLSHAGIEKIACRERSKDRPHPPHHKPDAQPVSAPKARSPSFLFARRLCWPNKNDNGSANPPIREEIARQELGMGSIRTMMNYVVRGESAVFNAADRAASYWPQDPHEIEVHDLRDEIDALSLDRNGFIVARGHSPATELTDPIARMAEFGREAEVLVAGLTGASKVISFGGMYRSDKSSAADGNLPAFGAHVDYGARTVRDFALDHLPPDEAERRLAGRHMLINIWRPIKPVERTPLALCDASTVARDDLFPSEVVGGLGDAGRRSLHGFNLAHNPAHRWTWLPQMQPEEAFVFRLFDSDPDAVQFTGHSAIADPNSPADAAPRESLEIRTIAFLD